MEMDILLVRILKVSPLSGELLSADMRMSGYPDVRISGFSGND